MPFQFFADFCHDKTGRRNRTTYKRWQIDELERAFSVNPYPTSVFKKTLALRLGLRDSRVQVINFHMFELRSRGKGFISHFISHFHMPNGVEIDSKETIHDHVKVHLICSVTLGFHTGLKRYNQLAPTAQWLLFEWSHKMVPPHTKMLPPRQAA